MTLKDGNSAQEVGKTVKRACGIAAGERLSESPPDGLANGDTVKVIPSKKDGGNGKA